MSEAETALYDIADELRAASDKLHEAQNRAEEVTDDHPEVDLQKLVAEVTGLRDQTNEQVRYVVRTAEEIGPDREETEE